MAEAYNYKPSAVPFGDPSPRLEHLARPWPANAPYELVETSYFGFSIPGHGIGAEIYYWMHPVLGSCAGGLFIYSGFNPSTLAADFLDYRGYMPLPSDVVDCTYENGVRIDMIEPMKTFRISYANPERGIELEMVSTAVMPMAVRASGGHFTQAMRNEGRLVMRGRTYDIGGYFSRDRSWGDPRSERPLDIPPIEWLTGVFRDDLAFHVTAFDSAEHHPEWQERYPRHGAGDNILWGYVWRDGAIRSVTRCDLHTVRAADGMTPVRSLLTLVDDTGASIEAGGTPFAQIPFAPWPNMTANFCHMRWQTADEAGHGNMQDCMNNEFVWAQVNAGR